MAYFHLQILCPIHVDSLLSLLLKFSLSLQFLQKIPFGDFFKHMQNAKIQPIQSKPKGKFSPVYSREG